MATSSITGGARAPHHASGSDMATLGPSDNSDSGSDSLGAHPREQLLGDSDATGTGEAVDSAQGIGGADILPDHLLAGRPGLRGLPEEQGEPLPDGEDGASDEMALAFDLPGSALDDPELMDTTADVADLAQESVDEEELPATELNGFAATPDRPAARPSLP